MPTTEAYLLHRASSPASFEKHFLHRVKSPADFKKNFLYRATNTTLKKQFLHRAKSPREFSKGFLHRAESPGVEIEVGELLTPAPGSSLSAGARAPGPTGWDRAWQFNEGICEVTIWAGIGAATDVSGIPYKVEITHGRSQAMAWAMYVVDDTGNYHPQKSGAFNDVFGRGKNHRMVMQATWGGRTFSYRGYATGFGHQRSADTAGWFKDFVWRGIDMSRPLFERSVTMPTVRSTRKKIARAVTSVREMLSAAGLGSVEGFKDFPVRLMHRQSGRYGEWLMRLLEVVGLQWRMRGETFVCYDAGTGHGPIYHYSVSNIQYSDNYDSEVGSVVTSVSCRRLAEPDEEVGGEPEVATTFGKYSKTFDKPLYGVQWIESELQLGGFSDFIFRDPNGNVVAVRDVRGGVWPQFLQTAPLSNVKSVEYTFGADVGVNAKEGYGKILFTGSSGEKPDSEDFPDAFNAEFVAEEQDDDLLAEFGRIHEELETNELIATPAEASSYLKGWLAKLRAALFPLSVTVPLNPALVDGARVKITDLTLGVTLVRTVINATHTFSDDPGVRRTVFTVGGYI